ncbi:MAG: hypothetical protein JWO19_5877, partial [Bryobacterales bacterium]|nr:hypothetical protein [Bryobacterales bacterium]
AASDQSVTGFLPIDSLVKASIHTNFYDVEGFPAA